MMVSGVGWGQRIPLGRRNQGDALRLNTDRQAGNSIANEQNHRRVGGGGVEIQSLGILNIIDMFLRNVFPDLETERHRRVPIHSNTYSWTVRGRSGYDTR